MSLHQRLFFIAETPDILTEALKPGDQFVSIDGKKTYFDIGPSNAPTDGKNCRHFDPFFDIFIPKKTFLDLLRSF